MASSYAVEDTRPLAEVLTQAVAPAGLSVDDEPVERAKQALAQQLFVNAYTMRFKRQRTGGWDWLQKEPFLIPMCLADLIGHCLDQTTASECEDNNEPLTYLPCNAALKFLLTNSSLEPSAPEAAFSNGSSTPIASVNQTPTLSAIRLAQVDEPIDFARNLALVDNDCDLVEKRSRSESPRGRRSITKSRNHKKSRSSRYSKPSVRQPISRPPSEPSPEPTPCPPPPETNTASPSKSAKKDAQALRDPIRIQRRSVRDSALVKAMINTLERISGPQSFHIDMIHAVSVLDDEQSSCDSDSSDNSGSDIDDEGRRPRRSTRSTPIKGESLVHGRDHSNSVSKRREMERSRHENYYRNGTSPKRKRINYSSDR